ncbi:MAG: sugar ABC transporter permease, partial [Acidothermus sp.]|nr:sugar ABC transporter permease [Acidothermus sp.]
VVATTIIITALKTFDIVYTLTNGNYDTEVIANLMIKEMFVFGDFGRASAVAVVLLLAIVPIMAFNIRRFKAQEAVR